MAMSPMEEDLNHAIAGVIQRHEEGGLVTRWVCLVETIDNTGRAGLWTMTSDGLKAWDTVGMLGHAMDLQRAQTIGLTTGLLDPDAG